MTQLFIHNIPEGVDNRKLRKTIGRAFKVNKIKVSFKVSIKKGKRASHGSVVFKEQDEQVAFSLVNHRIPVFIKNVQIKFKLDNYIDKEQRYWNQRQLEGVHGEDVESDYDDDEGGPGADPMRKILQISQVSCGAWDSEGQYVDAWARNCNPQIDNVTIDEERGRLLLKTRFDEIRINIYNIKYTVVDLSTKHLYLVLRALPTFISSYSHEKVRLRRSGLDEEHTRVSGFCYVYRIQYHSQLGLFLKSHARRLIAPDQLKITLSTIRKLTSKAQEIELDVFYRTLPFDIVFQVQALITSWQLLPVEVYLLKGAFFSLDKITGVARVKALANEIQWRDPRPGKNRKYSLEDIKKFLLEACIQLDARMDVDDPFSEKLARVAFHRNPQEKKNIDAVYIHCLTITPAGKQLSGPFQDTGNRILRKYPGLDNQYLRVTFKDEMGEMIKEERDIDTQTEILYGKFKDILSKGIVIGGCRFEFLAFSNSQLKSHGCWFVRSPLVVGSGAIVFANDIRRDIGDLDDKCRNAPLYAARLGQAFTTTLYSIKVPSSSVIILADYMSPCGGYKFSDGVGKISPDMVALLNQAARKSAEGVKAKATNVYQIRLDGGKGVLALDTTLQGKVIYMRESMVKFRSKDKDWDLAVATSYSKPLRFYLQRPLIALLESLGVPLRSFKDLQNDALMKIGAAASNTTSAARLLQDLGLGITTKVSSTLQTLKKEFDIDAIAEIPFFKEVIRTAISLSLRVIKYKARIRVPDAHTLMGVVDETGMLKEGHVYACLKIGSNRTYLQGKHLILRSPTLHPGDVQFAIAVGEVPKTSPLYALTNCLVFSRQGKRPLPSMLAGGDLDGDLYSIIADKTLFPKHTYVAAKYPSVKALNIGRPVETRDVIDFYLQYIVNDKVGMLANKHLIVSDQSSEGVLDPKCILLAEKYSTALDYPKTGRQVELDDVPRTYGKPDYMEHEYRVEERSDVSPNKLKLLARRSNEFYRSYKALGILFRQIEVSSLLKEWRLDGVTNPIGVANDWEFKLLQYLKPLDDRWIRFLPHQRMMVKFYYEEEESLAIGYHTDGRTESLSCAEVFLGCILLKSPFQASKNLYEAGESLRSNFRDLVKRFLGAASSPPECEVGEIEEMVQMLRRVEVDSKLGDEFEDYDYVDDDDDDNRTVRSQDFQRDDEEGGDGHYYEGDDDGEDGDDWSVLDSQEGSSQTGTSRYGDAYIADELHSSLYALLFAALEVQRKDASKMSCPWVVYPRLLAAKKNAERRRAMEAYM